MPGRRLYFLRHGLADRSAWRGDDDLRPLTPEGAHRLALSARTLDHLALGVDLILTSPLTRALQTAEIVADGLDLRSVLEVDPRLAHGFDVIDVAEILAEWPDRARIMLVGHEPTFSLVVGQLCGEARVVCKKGGLVRVDLLATDPVPQGELVWLLPPKLLVLRGD